MSKEILVYADWLHPAEPTLVGTLRSSLVRGSEVFSFAYNDNWLTSKFVYPIDPELKLFKGQQYNNDDRNFRIFLDSCPDRWGRLLMQRREAAVARIEKRKPNKLQDSDYLLGVHDMYRMGALRFKKQSDGPFLDDNDKLAAPPISSLRELEYAASQIEKNIHLDSEDYLKWLFMLISPGSSLGGARPKSCVTDGDDLWMAKFPSRYDDYDIGAWEYLTYLLAQNAGIPMSECKIQQYNSHHHTFLTKRFDRIGTQRIHFSSAMTQLGYYDGDSGASYLEIAQFLMQQGSNTKADLAQLWRRIVFNIAVSNSDDHLRNHGFLFIDNGWQLSPAYDINPVPTADGLHLNIDDLDNSLDYDLAFNVIEFFQLTKSEADDIHSEVIKAVSQWQAIATQLKIPRNEQQTMEHAFNL